MRAVSLQGGFSLSLLLFRPKAGVQLFQAITSYDRPLLTKLDFLKGPCFHSQLCGTLIAFCHVPSFFWKETFDDFVIGLGLERNVRVVRAEPGF